MKRKTAEKINFLTLIIEIIVASLLIFLIIKTDVSANDQIEEQDICIEEYSVCRYNCYDADDVFQCWNGCDKVFYSCRRNIDENE